MLRAWPVSSYGSGLVEWQSVIDPWGEHEAIILAL